MQINELWDSGVCHSGSATPKGHAILLHHRYKPHELT